MTDDGILKYVEMQKGIYNRDAGYWTVKKRDPVVGSFDKHNNHDDYKYIIKGFETKNMHALDFGCGPGRNIVKFNKHFRQIDGVDISQINLDNAKLWIKRNSAKEGKLILCNGYDLDNIKDCTYDFIMSTIVLQHICVYKIRYSYLEEFYRILKSKGWISIQMGYGTNKKDSVGYYENNYNAESTNGSMDTRVEDPSQLKSDLDKIGFVNFNYNICDVGPGDDHSGWIFFRAMKQ